MEVIDTGGEVMCDRIVEIMRRIPCPTVSAFHAAHAARYHEGVAGLLDPSCLAIVP